ncbi:MAG TPA: ubiquitin-like domain-containing protein [Mycobacteriales bacterium]|nr:ubiquitin-like domain-containing protein [Mycobacteriales bacterium]
MGTHGRRRANSADTIEMSTFQWGEYASTPQPRTRHRRRRAPVNPVGRPVQIGLYGVVLAGLVGGTTAWASMEKHVEVMIDGHAKDVHTYSGSVAGALKAAHVTLGPHDAIHPGKNAALKDGSTIVIDRAHPVSVDLDGHQKDIWTTSDSIGGVLKDLGVPEQGTFTSEPLDQPLKFSGNTVTVRTEKPVTVIADGQARRVMSNAMTVGQLLDEEGITLSRTDTVAPGRNTAITDGLRIAITRIRYAEEISDKTLDYTIQKKDDDTLTEGTEKVVQEGKEGTERSTYVVSYVNGKKTGRRLESRRVIARPVTKIVKVGTKPAVSTAAVPSASGRDWNAVAFCESTNDWSINTGNGFYGGLQFDIPTWLSNGGGVYAPRPDLASKAQQIAIADKVADARGSQPWPVCGSNMYH